MNHGTHAGCPRRYEAVKKLLVPGYDSVGF
jgi:hypothetical protein